MKSVEIIPAAGVRRQRRKDARPAEIIEAGMQEFAEHGFSQTKLDDVATRAGIAKGTIYRYFESKEALFEAAIKSRAGPVFDDVERVIELFPGSSESLIKTVIPQMYRELFSSDRHILMRIMIAESGRFPAIAEFYHRETIARGQKVLELIIQRGIARGEFRDGPIAQLPMIIVAPAIMAAVWKMTFDTVQPIAPETFLAAHMDLVLNGLLDHSVGLAQF
jgi:AcrR family transcriptional regulator